MFDPDARNYITSVYRDGKLITGDSNHDCIGAILFPSQIRDLLPDDLIVVVEQTADGPVERHRHHFRDHAPIERSYFK
jgi:hypothetical protein